MHTFTPILVAAALATVASAMKYEPRGHHHYPFNTTTEAPCPTAITTTYTTCYTTSYSSICDDGLCPHTYTITEYCPHGPCDIHTETTYIPPGFTTTVTECDHCGPDHSTVTITCPMTTTEPPYPSSTCDSEECCDGDDCYWTSTHPPESSHTHPGGPGYCCSDDSEDCHMGPECSTWSHPPKPTHTCPGGECCDDDDDKCCKGGVCPSKTHDHCGGGDCPEETGGCGGGKCPEETDNGCGGGYCPSSTGEEPPMFTGGAGPAHRGYIGSAVVVGAVAAVAILL